MSRRIAVAQMSSTPSIEQNLRQATDLIAQARLSNAQFVCLPEAFDYLVDDPGHALSQAISIHSNPLLMRYHSIAAQSDMWLSLGGMHIRSTDSARLQMVHFLLSPHDVSTPVKAYSKTHIDRTGFAAPTDATTDAGNNLFVAYETPVGNVGLTIGHDLYFPSVFASLREANAHVLLMPSALGARQGESHWHTLVRARAVENQCYAVAAAQVGSYSRECYGHSLVVAPYGNVLVDAGRDSIGLACADIDLDLVHQVRDQMPLRKQRRDDLLGKVIPASVL